MVIENPGDDIRDGREHARCSEESAEIARADARAAGEQDVADAADDGEDGDHQAALLNAVGIPGGGHGDEPGDEVGWGRKALGIDGGEAHVFDDGGEEDRQG